jgi:hypothetical protein
MASRRRVCFLPIVAAFAHSMYAPTAAAQPAANGEPGLTPPLERNAANPALVLEPWSAAKAGEVEPGYVVDQPKPSGMPLDQVRHNASAGIAAGTAALMCPNQAAECETHPGVFIALTLLHRPETWFAWGSLLEGFSTGQSWRQSDNTLSLTHNAATGRVLAQLHPFSNHHVDTYFGIGLGVGGLVSRAQVNERSNTEDSAQSHAVSDTQTTWSPFYAARLGVDLQLIGRFKLGVVADWSNFQALSGENCPWKAFGMCSSNGWGAFPPDNAVWKLGAALSFAFGQEL